ncbi:MAG: NAD(P)H-dependent oxidoreductase [Solobacterium sp.]|nr:NAD(P)H-dependent oxidoreductase [Solobacterium sp.]
MKTIKKLLLLLVCMFLVTGCSTKEESVSFVEEQEEILEETEEEDRQTDSANILVVYFSRAGENWEVGKVEKGSTRIVAEYIAETIGADLFEIEPVEPYPESYDEMLEIASAEQKENVRPQIKNEPENWDQYDTIVLGYPIWYADMPMIVYNFLETYDFNGKVIYPFDTHGGSGLAGTVNSIKETLPGIEVKEGLPIVGKAVQNQFEDTKSIIDQWLKENELLK